MIIGLLAEASLQRLARSLFKGKSQMGLQLSRNWDTAAASASRHKPLGAEKENQPECSLLGCKQPPLS